jgi:hypothetical protein
MMTERERLIELIDSADEECKHTKSCKKCSGYGKGSLCMVTHIADYLLANKVGLIPIGRNITENHPVDEFVCSECGFICEDWSEVVWDEDANDRNNREFEFNYCPNCGSKIEDFWKNEEDNK